MYHFPSASGESVPSGVDGKVSQFSLETSSTFRLRNRNETESKSQSVGKTSCQKAEKSVIFFFFVSSRNDERRVRDNPPNEMSNRIHYLRICLHFMAASARKLFLPLAGPCLFYLFALLAFLLCSPFFCCCCFMLVVRKMTKFFHFVLVLTFGETNFRFLCLDKVFFSFLWEIC